MPLGDTLEKLFSQEQEASIELAAMEFVTAGPNIESKTIIPLQKSALGIAFLKRIADDVDNEMREITDIYNQSKLEDIRMVTKDFKPSKKNIDVYHYERLSDNIKPVLNNSMILMPSINGKARDQLESVLKWLREEKSKIPRQDSITQFSNYLKT